MSRVLLLNPPGKRIYIRDYYCSKVSKSNYLYPPVDLLMLSGILYGSHQLHVLDAMAERLTPRTCLERIASCGPDVIIALIGAVSLDEDMAFLANVAAQGIRVIISGDVTRENPVYWLKEHPFIEAVIVDFTSEEIRDYLDGKPARAGIVGSKIVATEPSRPLAREFSLLPRHELFTSKNYRFPFVRHHEFATVLTEYGCPYPCSFCIMSTLTYRFRPVTNVIDELHYLKQLGTRELFFMDQTFGSRREQALELCRQMIEHRLDFGWVCFSRVDVVDAELLKEMKRAGCHTIIFGVESASEEILTKYRKGYTRQQIKDAFRIAADQGVRTVATFILGLPDETESTAAETIGFLKELDCDFVSFNIAVPRHGTFLRNEAVAYGLISPELSIMDQTGSIVAMPSRYLSRERIHELRAKAVKDFYLRPAYIWRRLRSLKTWYEFHEQLYEGGVLLREVLLKHGRTRE